MSGLRDVEAARELQKFAAELSETADPDLAHQSRVVLLGFEIQALQNGLRDEPGDLLAQLQQLFQRPEDRNFPEFMVLQQAEQVLMQMGFEEEAKQVRRLLVQEYNESPDPQLRGEAWLIETSGSQAYENFVVAFSSLGSVEFDASAALAAVRGLYQQFPSLQTLEQIAGTVTNIEYSGQVALSDDVASFIRMYLGEYGAVEQAEQRAGIEGVLEAHGARTGLLGSPLPLEGLIGFDGQPFQWSDYQGKVVLVDFWATWCIPCMRELPTIRAAHAALNSQGFEVLSVNMDDDLQAANDFVQKQTFPWRTFRADDPSQLGFRAPFAQRLGISAIPFMVLVGQDGKVSGLHVRGQTLIPTIRELLESRAK
jgi:thiol-disulfide isomerase/thioredoxin